MLEVHQFPCLSDNYGFLLHDPASIVLLHGLKSGTLLYPEQSCTVFLCVPEIIDGGDTIRLSGEALLNVINDKMPLSSGA